MNNLWPRLLGAVLCLTSCFHAAAQSERTLAPASPDSFVAVGDSKLYYQECGTASQTVVLVHDGVVDSAVWNDVWPEFCKHFHTIRYDRRGYGRSPTATTWYSETDDLAMLLHHLKITRAAIVGSSHGGQLSIDFTLAHPGNGSAADPRWRRSERDAVLAALSRSRQARLRTRGQG